LIGAVGRAWGAVLRTASFFHALYSLGSSIPEDASETHGTCDEYL
jgi:hypothetical protein